jgi:hypothetical protein
MYLIRYRIKARFTGKKDKQQALQA